MTTMQSRDVFGEALLAYFQGDRSPFYLRDRSGRLFETDLSRYFRTTTRLSRLERKLISLAHGDILDVGCGTGNYLPLLAQHGRVLGIDISPNAIDVGRRRGCKTCEVADIFTFRTGKRFDTITLLGNGLGIAGTVIGTKRLIGRLSSLLKDDGQILALTRRVTQREFVATRLRPVWKQRVGREFGWIHMGRDLLCDLCARSGLRLSVVQGNQHYYLIRLTKN
jgi:SAM-dependent methyltransferase